MKLKIRLEFGLLEFVEEIEWPRLISDFPSHVEYKKKKWELIVYKKDITKRLDYILIISEINSNNFHFNDSMPKFEDLSIYTMTTKCECGAIKVKGWEDFHSRWCPKWIKL